MRSFANVKLIPYSHKLCPVLSEYTLLLLADQKGKTAASCRFFFLVHGRPLGSTLFPYTTLFRSRPWPVGVRVVCEGSEEMSAGGLSRLVAAQPEDRKSTRLNSSHVEISYAVFCLKKKKCGPSRT